MQKTHLHAFRGCRPSPTKEASAVSRTARPHLFVPLRACSYATRHAQEVDAAMIATPCSHGSDAPCRHCRRRRRRRNLSSQVTAWQFSSAMGGISHPSRRTASLRERRALPLFRTLPATPRDPKLSLSAAKPMAPVEEYFRGNALLEALKKLGKFRSLRTLRRLLDAHT